MVDITICQQHRLQRGSAQVRWVQHLCVRHLVANVRRCVQNCPVSTIGAERHRRLGLGRDLTRPRKITVFATAIPLWQAASSGRAKNMRTECHYVPRTRWYLEQYAVAVVTIAIWTVHVDFHTAFDLANDGF